MLGNKRRLSKRKKTEIISGIFPNQNALTRNQLQEKSSKNTNPWRLNNTLLNKWITEEIKEEIKKYLETNENENTVIQNPWEVAKTRLRGKFIAIQAYLRKLEKSQIQPKLTHKRTIKRRTNKQESWKKERNHKDQSRNK